MTNQELQAAKMDLIERSETLRQRIVCLESKLRGFEKPFQDLANALHKDPCSIVPSDEDETRYLLHNHTAWGSDGKTPKSVTLEVSRFRDLLRDLQEATEEKERHDGLMEKGGLTRYVR